MLNETKKYIVKNFENFAFFYNHLKYKVIIIVLLSIAVGLLDGLGLTMFLPLLQLVSTSQEVTTDGLGKLDFIVIFLRNMGFELNLLVVLLTMTLFFILKGFAIFFQSYYQVVVQQFFIRKIRIENINDLNNIGYQYFMQADIGQIQNTLTGEVEKVIRAFAFYFVAFQQLIMVFVYMGFAFFVDSQFAILVSLGGILTNVIFRSFYNKTKVASIKLTEESNQFQGLIIQHVQHYKYLKATGFVKNYGKKLIEKVDLIQAEAKKIGVLASILKGLREPLLILVVSTVILIQAEVLGSDLGPILISLLFFYRALVAVMGAQSAWNTFLGSSGSLYNLKNFSKSLRNNIETKQKSKEFLFENSISLKNVNVVIGKTKILSDINIKISKNKAIAFVGESGSGKTTLINVLSGLLQPESGEISVDGVIYDNLNMSVYHKKIGYITQESVIFNDTIYNNVTLWAKKTESNLKRFEKAMKDASLSEFLQSTPQGRENLLGNNGVNLSGGQRQRISIARELFKKIEILILDEATSALDSETEKEIQKNIDALKGKYTVLIVAHRLSTIKNVDIIFYLNKGRVVSHGTFEELTKEVKEFNNLVKSQKI
ncbi:ABC transporter ATP-binding protein [Namhaeicola litoreus]|uniref:ABC transporter ATP-binding protein n=1 Tax=Namhaeicola litoreus TaxID=1052145 RepID=A0ABW3Y678_9FLAO